MPRWLLSLPLFVLPIAIGLLPSCSSADAHPRIAGLPDTTSRTTTASKTLIDQLLDSTLCDGFSAPTRTGNADTSATLCSKPHGGTDYVFRKTGMNDVLAVASGTVIGAFSDSTLRFVEIEHHYVENGALKTEWSFYSGVDSILCRKGQWVYRGQVIAHASTRLHFALRNRFQPHMSFAYQPFDSTAAKNYMETAYEKVSTFITTHQKLLVPAREDTILIALKSKYRMYVCHKGKIDKTIAIALGQAPLGHKVQQGDNRTPEGEYRIIQKSRGPFSGDYSQFLGVAWMRINYPNNFDAEAAAKKGTITAAQKKSITDANNAGKEPLKTTNLGGGIGIHGWAGDWTDDGKQNLTWGCISVRNGDLTKLYDLVGLQTKLIIHP